MSVLQAEVHGTLRTLDVPDEKAPKAAVALSAALAKVEDETTKGFSKRDADIDAIRKDVSAVKIDAAVLKWMGGVVLTMVTALSFRAFFH